MKKTKKLLSLMLVIVLTFVTAVGMTVAYFTDTDERTNEFTVGNVKIEQFEKDREGNDFVKNQTMMPAVYDDEDYSSKENVGVGEYTHQIRDKINNFVDKIVFVQNQGDSDAYIRTIIAFPEAGEFDTTYNASEQWLHWNGASDTDTTPNNGWIWGRDKVTEWPANTDNWDVVENVKIDDKVYDIYVVTNKNIIEPDETTGATLLGLFLDKRVDCEVEENGTLNYTFADEDGEVWNLGDISELKVLVASQAVQADGFDNAWDALDEAFGDITATNHPWYVAE